MRTGIILSGLLHLGLIVLAVVGLPRWFKPGPMDQQVIPIEFIAEVAEERSVPLETPAPPKEVAEVEPPPPPEPPPEPALTEAPEPVPPPLEVAKAAPEPPEPRPAPAPEPPPPEPETPKAAKPAPRPAPVPKAKPNPPPKPKPKAPARKPEPPKPDDFLSRMRQAVSKHEAPPPQLARAEVPKSRLADVANRLTMSEEDAVRRHIIGCWNPPVGARDAHDMEVRIIGSLRRDGVVQKVDVVDRDKARMRAEPFFRTFAESALRAFYKCRQLPLPPHKYENWKTFDIGFNLKDMLRE